MSETAAAMKAAKEVNADTVAPQLYQRANEAYFRAQNEYRMKNFNVARDYAEKAKRLAEEAEFESLRRGIARTSMTPSDDATESAHSEPYDYPTPTGTPAFIMEEQGATGGQSPTNPGSSTPSTTSPNGRPTPLGTPLFAPPPL